MRALAIWGIGLSLGALACSSATSDPIAEIPGAQFITFRCVSADGTTGMGLEGCGCVEPETGRRLGRIECTCRDALNRSVRYVRAAGGQPLRGDDGDWIADSSGDANRRVACEPRRDGQVRAYVGSGERGNVAVLDVSVDPGDDTAGAKQVLDVDRTIPGITSVYVDDLVSDIQTHPDGAFVFTVNSSSGTISVIREDTRLRESFKIDLGAGPLLRAEVWPPVTRADPVVPGPRVGFVSAPVARAVLQIDLDALGQAGEGGAADVVEQIFAMPEGAVPGHMALDPDGSTLFVSHTQADRITAFDVATGRATTFALQSFADCDDPYLVRVVGADEDPTCGDGLDNDADGLVDDADPDCRAVGSEATVLGCPKASECADGLDNDDDGRIDRDDPECDPAACGDIDCVTFLDWEGAVPVCADGVDNDGDGLIDRADPGCANEADGDETDDLERSTCANGLDDDGDGAIDGDDSDCADTGELVLPEEAAGAGVARCSNGVDDDFDGLIDGEDPGCTDANAAVRFRFERVPACADGVDNDFDGRTDYAANGGDPDCYAAVDDNEGGAGVSTGPTALTAARVASATGERDLLYVVDSAGSLQWIDLNSELRDARRISVGSAVQAISLRQRAYESSLLVIGDDTFLRSVQITRPTVVETEDGRPVFARLEIDAFDELKVKSFYTVVGGVAWPVEGLEGFVGLTYDPDDLLRIDRDSAVVSFDLDGAMAAGPVDLQDDAAPGLNHGNADPLVYLTAQSNGVAHGEDNLRRTAAGRNNRVTATPQLFVNNAPTTADFASAPSFCRRASPCGSEADAPSLACVPTGFTADGNREGADVIEARTACKLSAYEGIDVLEDRPESFPSDRFSLTFEGDIAGAVSRTGQFGGRDGDERWTLLDYDADYCRLGIEADDVVLVDVFVPSDPAAAEIPECRALRDQGTVDPSRVRERLRYRVEAVGQHKLALTREPRTEYRQRTRGTAALPTLFPAPPAPLFECAAQFIKYRVRVGNDQWSLVGQSSGFRHPWVAQDGQCVRDARRVAERRDSRPRFGVPFENEWFAFTLGSPLPADCVEGDPREECLPPYSIDTRFEFDVEAGTRSARLGDIILPGEIRWLPADDRLYVVDTALQAVVEIGGLDVYHAPLVKLRTIR